jgi:hypothetical protein
MPHHNRARLADISSQSLNPDLEYKKTGKNGLFVSNDKSKKTLEKVEVKQEQVKETIKVVAEDINKDQQEVQAVTAPDTASEQTSALEIEETVTEPETPTQEGFLVPNSAQKVADSTSQDSLKENKKKKKKS